MRRILVPVANIATVETRRKHQWLDDSSEDGGFEAPRKMLELRDNGKENGNYYIIIGDI